MPRMLEERNALVHFADSREAPEAPDVGVAIRFAFDAEARFKLGEPVVLHGAYSADQPLIQRAAGSVPSLIFLTLLRADKPFGETARLLTPMVQGLAPSGGPPAGLGPHYRQSAKFQVDLMQFFELRAEPGSYTVQASMAGRFSGRIEFDIVAR